MEEVMKKEDMTGSRYYGWGDSLLQIKERSYPETETSEVAHSEHGPEPGHMKRTERGDRRARRQRSKEGMG